MKSFPAVLLLVGASLASAQNFWLVEASLTDPCIGGGGAPCGATVIDAITQDSSVPGCIQWDNSRAVGTFGNYFKGPACGNMLNFYLDSNANQWNYFLDGGDGSPIGYCSADTSHTTNCLNWDLGNIIASSKYQCHNYDDGHATPCQ